MRKVILRQKDLGVGTDRLFVHCDRRVDIAAPS
jgi:hypothetical protein